MVRQAHHERININQKYYRKRSVSRVEFKTIIRHNYYRNNQYKLWVALSTVEDRFQAARSGENWSKTNHRPAKQDRVSQDSNGYIVIAVITNLMLPEARLPNGLRPFTVLSR
jgi:hypothetical protein